jgi:predicted phosphodiesterase
VKLIVIGDLHLRYKEPYYSAVKKWMEWFLQSDYNIEDNILIQLGDDTESAINKSYVNRDLIWFYQNIKCKSKIVLQGNHDLSDEHGSNLEILRNEVDIDIVDKPRIMNIEGLQCLFLPHISSTLYGTEMEKYYSSLYDRCENREYPWQGTFDYAFGHVEDETQKRSEKHKVCDLSKLDIKTRVFGHIHTYNMDVGGSYLGSVSPNSSTEVNKHAFIYSIDLDNGRSTVIECPIYLNYYSVTYPDPLPEIKEDFFLLKISKSVDRKTSVEYYEKEAIKQNKKLYVRRVERLRVIERPENQDSTENSDLTNKEFASIFYDKYGIPDEVQSIMMKCIK